ncbi:spore-associated protein [Streptomyces sp. WZ.A104]|uniref:spore-associated protein n=1 Tax=Streptomyces sp. WZ.A104 TaxID=2023771 RepID=UPI000BBBC9B3|nr:spore-associated protein [Streptomyces sp. WZ.A104]PCG83732.1 spore-associated protein [Streptomyces sp. WZ.A104]
MRFIRSVLAGTAVVALAAGGVTALAVPASAAPNTTPQEVCGSGYRTVNSAPVGSYGTVYLTYNPTSGKNCVTTIRSNPGTALETGAWIYVDDTTEYAEDEGLFTSYAGPVSVYGKGHCVDWGGRIANVHVRVTGSNCASLKEHRVTTIR